MDDGDEDDYLTCWSDREEDAIYGSGTKYTEVGYLAELDLSEQKFVVQQGSTKATHKGDANHHVVYQKTESGDTVVLENLLWVHGWRDGEQEGKGEAMTLAVLGLDIALVGRKPRVSYASLQLRLKSENKTDPDPELKAWGPFRKTTRYNATTAKRRREVTSDFKVGVSHPPVEASAGIKVVDGIAWDHQYSALGRSSVKAHPTPSEREVILRALPGKAHEAASKGKAFLVRLAHRAAPTEPSAATPAAPSTNAINCVMWQVHDNPLLKEGITDRLRVAALFSRPEPNKKYIAEVKIVVHKNMLDEKEHEIQTFLGLHGGDTVTWNPDMDEPIKMFGDGEDIMEIVKANELGALLHPEHKLHLSPDLLSRLNGDVDTPAQAATPPAAQPAAVLRRAARRPAARGGDTAGDGSDGDDGGDADDGGDGDDGGDEGDGGDGDGDGDGDDTFKATFDIAAGTNLDGTLEATDNAAGVADDEEEGAEDDAADGGTVTATINTTVNAIAEAEDAAEDVAEGATGGTVTTVRGASANGRVSTAVGAPVGEAVTTAANAAVSAAVSAAVNAAVSAAVSAAVGAAVAAAAPPRQPPVDSDMRSRLANLEQRMEMANLRIRQQDQLIRSLQQALARKK